MTVHTLEESFECMSFNDENDPGDGKKTYPKSKVCLPTRYERHILIYSGCYIFDHAIVADLQPLEPSQDCIRESERYIKDCGSPFASLETVDLDYTSWI
jgi:hypothetical protein